jgi:hypothetical protein
MASREIMARRYPDEQAQRLELAQDTLRFLRALAGERRYAEMVRWAVPLAMATRTADELYTYAAMFTVWAESVASEEIGRALEVD